VGAVGVAGVLAQPAASRIRDWVDFRMRSPEVAHIPTTVGESEGLTAPDFACNFTD
jgi:hypothetical protein